MDSVSLGQNLVAKARALGVWPER